MGICAVKGLKRLVPASCCEFQLFLNVKGFVTKALQYVKFVFVAMRPLVNSPYTYNYNSFDVICLT